MRTAATKRSIRPRLAWAATTYARDLDALLSRSGLAPEAAADVRRLGAAFYAHGYLCKPAILPAIASALRTGVPLLAVGAPGSGKTRLAEVLTAICTPGEPLLALYCHTDLHWQDVVFRWDEHRVASHWQRAREMAARGEDVDWNTVERHARSREMMIPGPLLEALDYGQRGDRRRVWLVDEADKAPRHVLHMLYQLLNDHSLSHPDLGRVEAPPGGQPVVVATANSFDPFEEAFLRRFCVLDFELPLLSTEAEILALHVPALPAHLRALLLLVVNELRGKHVRMDKPITVSEAIDTAAAWLDWGVTSPSVATWELSIPLLAKTSDDQMRVARKIPPAIERVLGELLPAFGSDPEEAIRALSADERTTREIRAARLLQFR